MRASYRLPLIRKSGSIGWLVCLLFVLLANRVVFLAIENTEETGQHAAGQPFTTFIIGRTSIISGLLML